MNPFIFLIALLNLCDLTGTLSAKMWFLHKNPLFLIATFLLFGAAGILFAFSLRYEGMAITNVLWISISVILVTLFGYFLFKENISLLQLAGIFTILVGLTLVNLK
jgi:multidrug transporter EmrE-like cation transporter